MVVYFADSSVQEAEAHKGFLYLETERTNAKGKLVKSKHPVYLNVWYTENELMSVGDWVSSGSYSKAVKAVSFHYPFKFPYTMPGEPVTGEEQVISGETIEGTSNPSTKGTAESGVPSFFYHVPYDEFTFDMVDEVPEQVTILLTLQKDKSVDLRDLVNVCSLSPRIRILGGRLLHIPGIRIGYFPANTIKGTAERNKNFVFPNALGSYDNFTCLKYSSLEGVQETVVKEKRPKSLRIPKQKTLNDLTKVEKEVKPKKISQSNLKSSFLSTSEVVGF